MTWLAAIAALLVFLLIVPVDVAVSARRRERLETRVAVRWLWGLVALPTPKGGKKTPRPKRRKKPRKPSRPSGRRRALAMLRTEDFPRRALRLPADLLRRIRVRVFDMDLRLGLDDPADTGRLWGVIGPAAAMLCLPPPARVAVTPEFAEPLLHLDARAEARIVPAALLLVLLAFALSPATLRAARAAARGTP